MEVVGEAEDTNGQRVMVRIADRPGQRLAQRLVAAGRLRLPSGYAAVSYTHLRAHETSAHL
eukprot:11772345-Alexandrium_andersonii.AAC.1